MAKNKAYISIACASNCFKNDCKICQSSKKRREIVTTISLYRNGRSSCHDAEWRNFSSIDLESIVANDTAASYSGTEVVAHRHRDAVI